MNTEDVSLVKILQSKHQLQPVSSNPTMKFSKIYSGIGAVLLFVVCMTMMNFSSGEQRVCGQGLRQTMEMMCPNGFHGYKTKRSGLNLDEDLSIEDTDEDFNFGLSLDMLPLLTSMENSGLAKIRRRRHGIVHECCDKPCTMNEMLSYCL
ncbi:probable insulin-like peptide 5 [Episyrphus balteatus]|uniref:probable insulin-like peptide 5 n=1 Tax=Episyrphus balteatus TaxID=286459 RepID=UPI0024856F10|nr:probable insulin-like peptide 5 [Episyrphus balteatus]